MAKLKLSHLCEVCEGTAGVKKIFAGDTAFYFTSLDARLVKGIRREGNNNPLSSDHVHICDECLVNVHHCIDAFIRGVRQGGSVAEMVFKVDRDIVISIGD